VVRKGEGGAKGEEVSAVWTLLIVAGLAYYFVQRNRRDTADGRRWFREEKSKAYMLALERHARGEITSEELAAAKAKFDR
jgi:uncharacterized membrane protein